MGHTLAHHGARSPETLGFMRKALDLRAVDLVGLLGVGAETVSPWETRERQVEHRDFALLGGLVADGPAGRDETRARLQALQAPAKVPSRVRSEAA